MPSRAANPLRKTISFRLALWYSAYFITSTALLFALAYVLLASTLRAHDRNSIEQRLHQLAAQYQATNLAGVKKELTLEAKLRHGKPFFIRIAGPRNVTIFTEIPDQWAEFEVGRLEGVPPTKAGTLTRLPAKDDEAVLEIASMRLANGGLLQVGKSTEERDSVLESFGWIVAGVMLPMVLIGVVGGAFLARQSLRPIRQLVNTVRAIKSGAMDARVAVRPANDELNELGTLFNGMLDRIEALVQGMRDALDNVAHDLRTPVARIRGVAEIALRSDERPERYREALADCVEESDQLLQMLNTLMDISEAETGALKLQRALVDVPALLADTIDLYRYAAEDKGIALSLAKPTPIRLTADRNRLRQVIANLLDNAIKYTPAGGRVEVSAVSEPRQVVIRVSDTGIGMTPDELLKIWERLYRGDRSRSERGLGLGLSLVKAIVEAHRGRVHAASTPGAGSTFTLVFPATPFADSPSPVGGPPIITKE